MRTRYEWQKSSRCQEGEACVTVAASNEGTILLTESSDPTRAILTTTPTAFALLIRALKESRTTGPESGIEVVFEPEGDEVRLYETTAPKTVVTTTREKWAAFVLGVRAGEFDHYGHYGELAEVGGAGSVG